MRYAFPFDLDELPVAASASGLVEAVTLFGAMLMIRIGTSMSASLQAVWDEETRTHSLISLLLAPISRMSLICAKTITMILLGFARIAVDLLFFAGLIVVLMGVSLGASFANKNMANSANMANTLGLDKLQWGQFLLVCTSAFLIFGLLCAAVALIVLAICKRRNVNVTLGTTMTFISLPPLMVLAPGFQLDSTLQWIPVLNLAGIVKMGLAGTLPSTTAVIVILEMMTLASIAMGCAVYLIHREQFALNSLE